MSRLLWSLLVVVAAVAASSSGAASRTNFASDPELAFAALEQRVAALEAVLAGRSERHDSRESSPLALFLVALTLATFGLLQLLKGEPTSRASDSCWKLLIFPVVVALAIVCTIGWLAFLFTAAIAGSFAPVLWVSLFLGLIILMERFWCKRFPRS